jgi:murein endopeptidase
MELHDLNHDQRLGLVALIEATAQADRRVSEEEGDMLAEVIEEIGDEEYRAIADEADRRFGSEALLKGFLEKLDGQEARELIFGTVLEMAMSDVVSGHESPLLGWLANIWQLDASVDAPSE